LIVGHLESQRAQFRAVFPLATRERLIDCRFTSITTRSSLVVVVSPLGTGDQPCCREARIEGLQEAQELHNEPRA